MTTTSQNMLLVVLSPAEQDALYGLPDFDDAQRLDYLCLDEAQLALACSRTGLPHQVWCILQIGYFKAKQTFFRFAWDDVQDDLAFVLSRYFPGRTFKPRDVTRYEHYAQRTLIAQLFGYRLWSSEFLPHLVQQVEQIARRDIAPGFIVAELIAYLNEYRVERPGYSTLQRLISEVLSSERDRLAALLTTALDDTVKDSFAQLLVRDDTLSELAVLKQDARDFGWRQMVKEREKLAQLQPLYQAAKAIVPLLAISQQNLHHYASLANFYTVYDLRRMNAEQSNLYLLCFAWQRYRQLTDNLVEALGYHMKKIEDESKALATRAFIEQQLTRQRESPRVGRLLLLYVDDALNDTTPFGTVRQRAFRILPRDQLKVAGQRLSAKPRSQLALRWEAVDRLAARMRRHLRPLFEVLDLTGITSDNSWLAALAWMNGIFAKQQRLSTRPVAECPEATVPARLRPYLLTLDTDGNATGVQADRYEFWVYRQVRKRLQSGDIYLDDSHQHRHLSAELIAADKVAHALQQLDIPWVRQPLDRRLAALKAELHDQWLALDRDLRAGKLPHLDYDEDTGTLTCRRPKAENDGEQQEEFYDQRRPATSPMSCAS